MPRTKIVVTLEATLLDQVDELVRQRRFPNRSQAIEAAVAEQVVRFRRTRLAAACAWLDPHEERAIADEGLGSDVADWPEH